MQAIGDGGLVIIGTVQEFATTLIALPLKPGRRGKEVTHLSTGLAGTTTSERPEEHTSELQSHSFTSYAAFCLQKKKKTQSPGLDLVDLTRSIRDLIRSYINPIDQSSN